MSYDSKKKLCLLARAKMLATLMCNRSANTAGNKKL